MILTFTDTNYSHRKHHRWHCKPLVACARALLYWSLRHVVAMRAPVDQQALASFFELFRIVWPNFFHSFRADSLKASLRRLNWPRLPPRQFAHRNTTQLLILRAHRQRTSRRYTVKSGFVAIQYRYRPLLHWKCHRITFKLCDAAAVVVSPWNAIKNLCSEFNYSTLRVFEALSLVPSKSVRGSDPRPVWLHPKGWTPTE